MSDDVSTDTGAQPEGQGAVPGEDAPYAEYLAKIPEEVRADVEPVFKEWDSNVTRRFQDHSEFRKAWEPLSQTGIDQYSPEEVQWLAQFGQAVNDPQVMQAWWNDYAQQNGINTEPPPEEGEPGFVDPEQLSAVERLLEERLGPLSEQLQGLTGWQQQQQQAAQAQAGQRAVEEQFTALESKHGQLDRNMIERFVGPYVESDPEHAIERAHSDYVAFVADIEKRTLAQKLGQPPAAESGGVADGTPEPVKGLKGAGEIALSMLRESRRS